jgi:hypothetical protein
MVHGKYLIYYMLHGPDDRILSALWDGPWKIQQIKFAKGQEKTKCCTPIPRLQKIHLLLPFLFFIATFSLPVIRPSYWYQRKCLYFNWNFGFLNLNCKGQGLFKLKGLYTWSSLRISHSGEETITVVRLENLKIMLHSLHEHLENVKKLCAWAVVWERAVVAQDGLRWNISFHQTSLRRRGGAGEEVP